MSDPAERNLTPEAYAAQAQRERVLGQRAATVWLTGLSGAGKTTIARALEQALLHEGRACTVLDGDNLRAGLNADLGFSAAERAENLRRVSHVASLMNDAGLIVIAAFIAPLRAAREAARAVVGAERFVEVYLSAPVEACRERDPKGLYARADAGELPEFTGVSAPYEAPEAAELVLDTSVLGLGECVARLLRVLEARVAIPE
ncbi:MAG: adenylyl-sulfate kinase [Planctomycetes bacterium]|nr:adenylyl-sulfate kinase [Planctomycetota bacterium]